MDKTLALVGNCMAWAFTWVTSLVDMSFWQEMADNAHIKAVAWISIINPTTIAALCAASASAATGFYFIVKTLRERQRMKHEDEIHKIRIKRGDFDWDDEMDDE